MPGELDECLVAARGIACQSPNWPPVALGKGVVAHGESTDTPSIGGVSIAHPGDDRSARGRAGSGRRRGSGTRDALPVETHSGVDCGAQRRRGPDRGPDRRVGRSAAFSRASNPGQSRIDVRGRAPQSPARSKAHRSKLIPHRLTVLPTCRTLCQLTVLLVTAAATIAHADAPEGQLEEVLVTARKRTENLQQVPVSVTAYTGEQLSAESVSSLSDLGQVTPNFLYGQQVQSGTSAGQLYIRGVGQHDTQTTFNPSVG